MYSNRLLSKKRGHYLYELEMMDGENSTSFLGVMGETTGGMAVALPLDLVAEFLCRLPVKSLLQLRCVCKSWNNLISNDLDFTRKHLHLSTKRQTLITSTFSRSKELTVTSYPLDSLQLHSIFTTNATELVRSPLNPHYCDDIIASCDGLICLANNCHVVLWNPSIRKLKKLPSLEIPQPRGRVTYAFGCDPFINSYKVVSVFCCDFESLSIDMKGCKSQVKIYTLGTHSWRRIQDFPPCMVPCGEPGITISGTVNWFAYSDAVLSSSQVIVSLDLETESYRQISQPDYGMQVNLTLGTMRDCLCVFSHSHSFNDVWLLQKCGNKESWIKLIRLPYFGDHDYFIHHPKIVYISEDDNHVLLYFKDFSKLKWVVYDFKHEAVENIKIQEFSLIDSMVYIESLILLGF
ncbi:hypothetical protein RYX36_018426 [Vicia faba]